MVSTRVYEGAFIPPQWNGYSTNEVLTVIFQQSYFISFSLPNLNAVYEETIYPNIEDLVLPLHEVVKACVL
jgi:hypothetical protein